MKMNFCILSFAKIQMSLNAGCCPLPFRHAGESAASRQPEPYAGSYRVRNSVRDSKLRLDDEIGKLRKNDRPDGESC